MMVAFFVLALALSTATRQIVQSQSATEAPTGFDGQTNGLIPQGAPPPEGTEPVSGTIETDKFIFDEREGLADGLGPVYNAQGCGECHQNPVSGAISQITELRAGHLNSLGQFVEPPGGSLINDRAVNAALQERVPGAETIRSFRASLNTLGDGFVEAISNTTLNNIAAGQPAGMRGQVVNVPVLEANGALRVGRFGWKCQHASLVSFSADAYLNEMGITNRFFPVENTSLGASVAVFDTVPDDAPCADDFGVICGEDPDEDINVFAEFMRATKAPPRDTDLAATANALAGSNLFNQIGCDVCHVRSITTAAPGTLINGGAFRVPPALGNKVIHPFSDFLLHNVGTGDGIVQNGGQSTANKMRTAPLWGLRTRDRLMHDGESLTRNEAILRHAGEATGVINSYRALSTTQKNQLITFLNSL
jgi:CxxC motif-containing protein (DUF1111 family)